METVPDHRCPITTYFLQLVGSHLHSAENELLYANMKGEYEHACRKADTAGSSRQVQILREFVLVETMATVIWAKVMPLGQKMQGRHYVKDLPKATLYARSYEALTNYIEWAEAEANEKVADRVHFENFSTVFDREAQAGRASKSATLLTLAIESAGMLRRHLRGSDAPASKGIVDRFYASCVLGDADAHAFLKYARNLLSITETNAPRGWEFP